MDWKKYGYTVASKYRIKIVLSLSEKPKMPKEIAQELGFYLSHVSSTLSDLVAEGIVKCFNPSQKRGKIFSLTELGQDIAKELKNRKL